MQKTEFAGLTALEPGEPLSADGYSFQTMNPRITDSLLKLGARTHRHDEHPPIAGPIDAPGVTLTAAGNLPADADIAICYTLVDSDGGETLPSPVTLVTTAPAMEPPDGGSLAEVEAVGGHITAGSYTYAITLTDGNGETPAGAPFFIDVPPGTDTNVITLNGFADIVAATPGATGWRLYKSSSIGQLHFLAAGGAGLDEVVDDGMLCADCNVTPPTTNTTSVAQGLEVIVPASVTNVATGVVGYRVYAAVGGAFASPSFVEQRNDFGEELDYTHIVVNPGMPPDVSTSFGGAQKINPDTELLDWHWKRPVPTQADLPEPAEGGDVRVVEEDGTVWIYDGATNDWIVFTAPAMNWRPAVADASLLPPPETGTNVIGDVRLVLNTRKLWAFTDQNVWTEITAPQHIIRSDIAAFPQRSGLQFLNCDVVDDAGNDTTIVTAKGSEGGGGIADLKLKISQDEKVEWTDDAGITRLSLRGQRNAVDVEWFADNFDTPPLMEWGGSLMNVGINGNGELAPLETHPVNEDKAYWKGNAGALKECDIVATGIVLTENFNFFGIGSVFGANGMKGIYLTLIRQPVDGEPGEWEFKAELKYRLDEGAAWTVIRQWDVDPAAMIADEHMGMNLRRDGDFFTVGMWNYDSSVDLFFDSEIEVPQPLLAFEGAPAIVSNITDVDSWVVNEIAGTYVVATYQLFASAPGATEVVLVDGAMPYAWMYAPGDVGAGWYAEFSVRKTDDGGGVQFRGKISKTADAAPLADELMFTFDNTKLFIPSFSVPVVTGDTDGNRELGILRFDANDNTMRFVSGRATDPATKLPYVALDGVSY